MNHATLSPNIVSHEGIPLLPMMQSHQKHVPTYGNTHYRKS